MSFELSKPSETGTSFELPSIGSSMLPQFKVTPAANLDEAAQAEELARRTNVPSVVVASDMQKYQGMADALDQAREAAEAPMFSLWMQQDRRNLSNGRADFHQLVGMERIFQGMPKPEPVESDVSALIGPPVPHGWTAPKTEPEEPQMPAPLQAGELPQELASADAEIGQAVPQPQVPFVPMTPEQRQEHEKKLRAENKRRADEILARQRLADIRRWNDMDYTSVADINPETGEAWQNPFEKDRWNFNSQVWGADTMKELTRLRQESGDYAWSDKTGSMLYRALRKGSQGLGKDVAGLNWFVLEAMGLPVRGLKAIGYLVGAEGLANLEVPFEEGATMMRQLYDQLDQELGSYKEEEVGTLAKFGLSFVESIPQMLPQIASAVFAASPASLRMNMPGAPMALKSADDVMRKQLMDWFNSYPVRDQAKFGAMAATAVAGAQIFGSLYGDARLNGADMAQAAGAALGDATVQSIMENISFRKMFDIWQARGWKNLGKSIFEAGLTEFATEALQQYPDEFFSWIANAGTRGNETATSLLDRLPEITSEAIQSGLIGAAWAPILGMGGIRGLARKERMLKDNLELFEALDQSARGSKLREKLPAAYADAVNYMLKDGPVTDIYVSPEAVRRAALATNQDTLALAQTMGVSEEEWAKADETGADLQIPLATWQTKVAGTDAGLHLKQAAKTSPDAMTLAEAERERGLYAMTIRDAVAKLEANQALDDELSDILEPIKGVLMATDSGFTESQAETQLLLMKANAVAWADIQTRDGKPTTPAEFLRAHLPQVRRVDAEGNVVATTEGQAQGQQGQKLNQFYGEQGMARLDKKEKTRRIADLDLARQMETAGKDAQEVKLATGWERGADGKWRYEMPDPQFVPGVSKMLKGGRPRLLWKLLKDGKKNPLIRAYPELASYKIQETKMPANNPGVHYGSGLIKVSDNLLSVTDFGEYAKVLGLTKNQTLEHILYHELQHAIQSQEGFAKGGSPSQFSDFKEEVRKLREIRSAWEHDAGVDEFIKKSVKEVMDKKKTLDQHWADIDEFKKNSPYAEQLSAAEQQIKDFLNWWSEKYGSATTPIEIYKRLMGEVEARNVQARSDMTPEERRASLAASTEDVAREDQILLGARREEPQTATEFKGSGPSPDASIIGSPVLYQVQNLQEWEENTRALMKDMHKSDAEIEDHIQGIYGQLKLIEATSPEDRIGANLAAQVVGAGQATQKKRNKGIPYSGPVRSNEDDIYRISFDASSMCVKRLGAAATQKEVEKRIGRPLTTAEATALVALMQANGKAAPCLYCYVEGNRKKAVELVGDGIKLIEQGESEIPGHWKKGRRANAIAAMKEYRDAGMKPSDIHWEYVLDPAEAFTSEAIAAREKYPNIYTFLNLEAASTKQNKIKLYEEYTNQLLDLSDDNIELLNGFAGVRFFSSSDFQVEHIVDLAQAMSDMELKKIKSHAYTKVMLYVDVFGDTHQKINMSCFAKEDKDGNIIADTAQGWNWEEAKKRRDAHPDCGTVLVASSDKIVRWAMHQDWIDYIIPYHYSGNEKKYWGPAGYQDFSRDQVEKFVYPDKTPVGVPKGEYKTVNALPENERSEYALRKCFNRKAYPVKLEAVFTDIAKSSATDASKRKLAKERWEQMVASGEFSEEAINPNYWAERLEAGWTTEDKPMFPHEVKKVRMYEIADPNDKNVSTIKGISNERASKIYLEMCLNRKNDKGEPDPIVPVFPAFMFKEELFADLDAKWKKKIDSLTGAKRDEAIQKHRSAQTNLATEKWREFVEKGEIDYSIIDLEMFKFKKDYARTDTEFQEIDASKMHLDLAKPALEEVASTPTGLKEKYAPNMIVADQLERIINYAKEHGIENIGIEAIKALVEQKHPVSAITGGPELPTRYGDAEVYTSKAEAEGRTLQQTMPEQKPQTPEQAQDNRTQAQSLVEQINDLFQRAWHGSPFKFDRFTLDHIGEGEGQQIHGWGLYFARSRIISDDRYRKRLTDKGRAEQKIRKLYAERLQKTEGIQRIGRVISFIDSEQNPTVKSVVNEIDKLSFSGYYFNWNGSVIQTAKELAVKEGKKKNSVQHLRKALEEHLKKTKTEKEEGEKEIERLKKAVEDSGESGQLYEVEIPDDDVLLDEQKTLAKQPKDVQKALENLGSFARNATGKKIYDELVKRFGSAKTASLMLKEQGVLGITYEGRTDGRCFVVWDEDAIEIYNTLYMAKKEAQNTQPRGQFSYTQTQKIITLFNQNADLSTFAHELGHFFFNNMREMVERGEAPEQIAKDYQTLQDYAQSKAEEWYSRNDKKNYGGRSLDQLSEAERQEAMWRAREEVLAEGWMSYLKEGKAPSDKLKGVFRRFRQWLVSIYKALRHQGFMPINPDVRAVFDRMLASEAECEAAAARHAASDAEATRIDEVGQAMLTAQEQERLKKARNNAVDDSKEKSFQDALKAYWSATKEAEQKHDAIKREVESRPHFAAMLEALANGGINRDSIVAELGEEDAKALAKKRPGLVRKEGGIDINQVGVNQGYEDLSWVDEILDGPTVGEAIKEEMEAWKQEREKEIRKEMQPEGVEPGDPAYYNDERLTALLLEATAMQRAAGRKTRTVGNADAVHEWAKKILDDMPMRQAINIGNLSRAEARAAGEASTLLAKGDKQGAADAKRRQAIAHAMVLEALKLRKLKDALERAMARWNRRKITTQDQWHWQEQLRALAQRYSIGGRNKFAPERPQELQPLADFIKAYDAESANGAPPFPAWLVNEQVPDKLTAGQYWDISYLAKWLSEGLAPDEVKMVSDGLKGMYLLDAVTEGVTAIESSGNTFIYKDEGTVAYKAQMAWNDLFAGLDNAQFVFMAADGYKEVGKRSNMQGFHSKLFQHVKDALARTGQRFRNAKPELERLAKIRSAFCDRFEREFGKRAATINGIPTPDVMQKIGRRHWTAEMIWSMARNRGNGGNLKTLHEGLSLEDDQIDALTSILTAEEWQAVADECALVSSSYEDADRAFRAVYGMPMPDKVQPEPFTATTADGSTIDLPGWYFPISVDSALSPEIGDKQEVNAMKNSPDFTALGPSMRIGATHARTGTGKATALRFAVFEQALWDQWRMIEMGPIVRDFDKLMRNGQWRRAFTHAFGPKYFEQMRQWLKYTARPSQEKQDVVNRTFTNFRSASTIFSLGLNVQTFLRQFGGYPQAIPDVGAGWIVRGIGKAFLNPRALWQEVNRLSPMMADRDKSFVRELREYTAQYKESKVTIAGHDFTRQDVQECAMALVTLGDRMTTYPIWWGAYQRGIQKHAMSQEQAVAYADGIVSKTQAVASEADINAWQRDNGFKRLLSMFMSESLRKGSRMRYWYRAWRRGQVPFSEYAWHFSNETFGVALLFLLMKAALTSSAPDKDDVAWAVFDEALGPIPMLNQLSSVMQYNTSPSSMSALKGFDLIGRTFQKGKKWAENPKDSDAIEGMFKAAVDMAAFTAGTGNVRRVYETAAEGWKDVSTGKSQNPFRMFLKGFDKDKK